MKYIRSKTKRGKKKRKKKQGPRGVPKILLCLKSYFLCDLKPLVKFPSYRGMIYLGVNLTYPPESATVLEIKPYVICHFWNLFNFPLASSMVEDDFLRKTRTLN